eukprot:3696822-Lingulodinium_polyedra.AAC.1
MPGLSWQEGRGGGLHCGARHAGGLASRAATTACCAGPFSPASPRSSGRLPEGSSARACRRSPCVFRVGHAA